MIVGRPPSRPRARAAFKPACVRSRISWRSNSAIAPKMWNTSRPDELVVSMPSVRLRKPSCRSLELADQLDQMPQRAAETIQAPDHERVLAVAQLLERLRKLGPFRKAFQ